VGYIIVTLACDCGRSLQLEGNGPSGVGVTTSRLLDLARFQGWTRERGRGWRCPTCSVPTGDVP